MLKSRLAGKNKVPKINKLRYQIQPLFYVNMVTRE